mmetsp:Transcript_16226/g.32900  ORF Transcript_16226/g.32900 Transcript_16226/m.32900 type:complete len:120 (+) Transcript_16226:283-642(+)
MHAVDKFTDLQNPLPSGEAKPSHPFRPSQNAQTLVQDRVLVPLEEILSQIGLNFIGSTPVENKIMEAWHTSGFVFTHSISIVLSISSSLSPLLLSGASQLTLEHSPPYLRLFWVAVSPL